MDIDADRSVLYSVIIAAAVSLLITPLIAMLARRVNAVALPSEDRHVHTKSTPLLGGVAIFVGIAVAALTQLNWDWITVNQLRAQEQLMATLFFAGAVVVLGALDDIFDLKWYLKLGGQIAAAAGVVLAPLIGNGANGLSQLILIVRRIDPPLVHAFTIPNFVGICLVILWIVALMNMMNFIDGVDGLAAGICSISALTFAIIAASYDRSNVAILAAATAGGSIGFLRHNFRKGGASIFMGDAGSMLLGYMLAVIAIQGVLKTAAAVSLIIPFALVAIPLLDTMFVVAKRLKYKLPVSNADRWHLHHRMLNVGFSPRKVAMSFWLWTASMSAVALALRFVKYGKAGHWNYQGLAIVGVVVLIALGVSIYLAVALEIIKSRRVRERNARIAAERARD